MAVKGKTNAGIMSLLRQIYFWDVDLVSGKAVSKRLVIERVFTYGTLDEIALLIKYYGEEEVTQVLINLNYIDPKTLNFVSKYFRRSKKDFKCYTRKRLMPQHWNY